MGHPCGASLPCYNDRVPSALRRESAFERFQNLARRLFAVPKLELDEKLAAYQKGRKKRAMEKRSRRSPRK